MVKNTRRKQYTKEGKTSEQLSASDEERVSDGDLEIDESVQRSSKDERDSNLENPKMDSSDNLKVSEGLDNSQKVTTPRKGSKSPKGKSSRMEINSKTSGDALHGSSSESDRSRSRSRSNSRRQKFTNTRIFDSPSGGRVETVTTPFSSPEKVSKVGPGGGGIIKSSKAKLKKKLIEEFTSDGSEKSSDMSGAETVYETSESSSSSDNSDQSSSDEEDRSRRRSRSKQRRRKDRKKRRKSGGRSNSRSRNKKRKRGKSRSPRKVKKRKEASPYLHELAKLRQELENLKRKQKEDKGTKKGECTKVKQPKQVKSKRKSKLDNNMSAVGAINSPNKIPAAKARSDTTMYAPGLANNIRPGASPNLIRELEANQLNKTDQGVIIDFIKKIRLSETDVVGKTKRAKRDVAETDEVQAAGASGLDQQASQEEHSQQNDVMLDRTQQARVDAQENILRAERFRASLAPTGILAHNSNFALARQADPDDDFFHITCHVEEPLRQRIRKGEFVELEKLLIKKHKLHRDSEDQKLELYNKNGQTYFVPSVDRDTRITGLHRWDQAFRIYATIYSQANPTRAPEIWQYIDVIHRAARAFNWENVANYDYTFRQLMAANPSRNWSKTYTQMWNLTLCEPTSRINPGHGSGSGQGAHSNTSGGKKTGLCWRFNKSSCKFGDNCRFEHRCNYCYGLGHGSNKCFKRTGGKSKDEKASKKGGHDSSSK